MGPKDVGTRILLMVFALLLLVPSAFAQNPVGTWTGKTSEATGLQVRPITLILNADGTGTMASALFWAVRLRRNSGSDTKARSKATR